MQRAEKEVVVVVMHSKMESQARRIESLETALSVTRLSEVTIKSKTYPNLDNVAHRETKVNLDKGI